MKKLFHILFLFIFSLILNISCNKKDDEGTSGTDSFRKDILSNIGDNLIIPNYQDLKLKADLLDEAVVQFNTETTEENLIAVRNTFKDIYRAWQYSSVYEFGPAEAQILRASLNTFPTTTSQINSNIASGNYNLRAANNLSAKGLPAVDYLLYGVGGNDAEVLEQYTSDVNASNRKAYLAAVSADIKNKINTVYNEWIPAGGNYIETFINASGTDVGSSFGQLVNQLNYDFELIKNPKIGIPLGKKTLGEKLPSNVEALYSGISSELALLNVTAIEDIYLGRSQSGNVEKGLYDYLKHLNAQYNGSLLADAIKNQFQNVKDALDQVPDPLSITILDNTAVVEIAYTEIQRTVVLLKTDMPSAMGILITYQDNDGD